ncbi:MAG: ScyD/ScyE family protein [Propionicimonas sp.]
MKVLGRAGVIALATALGFTGGAAGVGPASASTPHDPARVVAKGLNGPFGLHSISARNKRHGPRFVVAESDVGQVSLVGVDGARRVLIDNIAGVSGVATGWAHLFALTGGPNEEGVPPTGAFPPSSVVRADSNGHHPKVIADLLQYELDHNPDGQVQLVDGKPVDALSNPFSMNLSRFGLLVADGGANDVLRVDPKTGHITTFFVPPTAKTPECLMPGAQANPGTIGCDPVPTGIAVRGDSVYVSTLGAESPGAGKVYRLDGRTGKVQHVYSGLTAPTGVAVSPSGTIYVSEVLYGAPAGDGPPPAGFDPSSVGRITKISDGRMTHTHVTMPTGLEYMNGHLYASSWSIASFLGIKNAGEIVEVNLRSFS